MHCNNNNNNNKLYSDTLSREETLFKVVYIVHYCSDQHERELTFKVEAYCSQRLRHLLTLVLTHEAVVYV